ncbi:hypothetical protein [Haladaptatus sp. CMAA 1911]|uniref:hypothetical protein n=1 Tax=unclassified Haladaptatus TaxID=2622732 RepID=UPI0037550065
MSQLINFVRDYETEESVDDESPNLAAETANAGRPLFETVSARANPRFAARSSAATLHVDCV